MTRAEVLVVGAGLAGASAAWWLAGEADVLVLEQGDQPGAEASAQNAGMLRRLAHDPVERTLVDRSARHIVDPGEDWAEAPPFRRTGAVLALADRPEALDGAAADLAARGVRIEAADPAAIGHLAPALDGAPLRRAWVLPDEGVVDAHALVTGFLRGARRRGARVACARRVTGIRARSGRVLGVETEAGPVSADVVLLAAGAWSRRLAAGRGLERPLQPLARHLLISDPHPMARPEHPWCWVDDAGIYARPEGLGWLCSPCDEAPLEPAPGPGSAGPVQALGRALAADKLERFFPALGPLRLARGWVGLRTFAPDRRPLIGPDPELDGLWWLSGLGGFGVSCCFAAGELCAQLLGGREPDWIDPAAVAPGRDFSERSA